MKTFRYLPVNYRQALWLSLVGLFFVFPGAVRCSQAIEENADQEKEVSVAQILDSWKQRENSTQSLLVKWRIDRTGQNQWSTYQADSWAPSQKESLEEVDQLSLILSGHRLRFEQFRWHVRAQAEYAGYPEKTEGGPSGSRNHFAFRQTLESHFDRSFPQLKSPHRYLCLYEKEKRTDYFQHSGRGISFAKISSRSQLKVDEHTWIESSIFRPILLTYRSDHWNQGPLQEEEARILNSSSMLDGQKCIVLEFPVCEELKTRYWIDPERDFLILRSLLLQDNHTMEQIDITYKQEESSGWIPERWVVILNSHNKDFPGRVSIYQFVSCQLTQIEQNPAISDDLFQINFPPETYIFDSINKKNFLILSDGTTKKINSHDLVQLDLMGNLPQPKILSGWPSKNIMGIVLIFIAVSYLYFRRRRYANRLTLPNLPQEHSDE